MNYHSKYLKYKFKYDNLKKHMDIKRDVQKGGLYLLNINKDDRDYINLMKTHKENIILLKDNLIQAY